MNTPSNPRNAPQEADARRMSTHATDKTTSTESPLVSILICTRDREEHLRQTLDSLSRVQVPDDILCELIVVDNGSSDGTAQLLSSYQMPQMPLRSACEARPGQVRARNTALSLARGEIIVFTDDDVRFPPDWIDGMCRPILRGEADAVAGGIRFAPHLERAWMQMLHRRWLASTGDISGEPQELIGANMAFSRRVLDKVPAFDPALGPGALGFYDDTLFSYQLLQAGFRLKAKYDSEVEHHFQESRLLRSSFEDAAAKRGRSAAYLEYHWEHRDVSFLPLRFVKSRLVLLHWRARKWRERGSREGLPVEEMNALWSVFFYRQFALERKRPRLYEKRGLRLSLSNRNSRD